LARRGGKMLAHADDLGGIGHVGALRAFAHGTSPENALRITTEGLSESAGRSLSRGGRFGRPGSFHTFELGAVDSPGAGMQLAYEMGLRHGSTSHVSILQLPESIYLDLVGRGLVQIEAIPGASIAQTVFLPGSFSTINRHAIWQIVRP
jgi:hypothetical protein